MRSPLLVFVAALCLRCVPLPSAPELQTTPLRDGGFFVVCEGLWRQDNATLSYVNPSGTSERDVVSSRNPGLRLGDTGSDILVRGDSVYVCVSTSGTIEVYHRTTGVWKGRIRFENGRQPYHIARVDDTVAICSMINDDAICEVNLRLLQIRIPRAPVGPAPEGLCALSGKLYVANSGLGDLRVAEAGAGTVSILDALSLRIVDSIKGLPNAMSCSADAVRNRIWITYRNLTSQPDSLGGIVLYDPSTSRIVDHQRYSSPKGLVIDPSSGAIYILHRYGIDLYDPNTRIRTTIVAHESGGPNDVWYSLGWWASQQLLLVGNARSYVTDGEVIAIDLTGTIRFRTNVGLNPASFE